ncbi:MAG: hypothetical protein WD872_21930 [Pirellulaceae bacterium]
MAIDAPAQSDAEILAEVFATGDSAMFPELARWILSLHFTQVQQARVQNLAELGNERTLSPAECAEVEKFRRVGNLLTLLRSKARLALRRSKPAESV